MNNTNKTALTNIFNLYGSATIALAFSSVLSGGALIVLDIVGLLSTAERQSTYNDV